jgi:DNA-binding protein H-NS
MNQYGVTVDDISSGSRAKPSKAKGSVAEQFKKPETGETWIGRGRAPLWLAGKDRDEYRIPN